MRSICFIEGDTPLSKKRCQVSGARAVCHLRLFWDCGSDLPCDRENVLCHCQRWMTVWDDERTLPHRFGSLWFETKILPVWDFAHAGETLLSSPHSQRGGGIRTAAPHAFCWNNVQAGTHT